MTEDMRKAPDPRVDQYGDAFYRIVRSRVADRETAEDLVQETFMAALRGRERSKGRSSVRTWLIGILQLIREALKRAPVSPAFGPGENALSEDARRRIKLALQEAAAE
jgi:RNA polymerase sigma factor (sigma-70 family)